MKNLLNLFRFMKPYKIWAILAPLSMVLEVLMDLTLPMLLGRAVDIGLANNDVNYTIKIGALMLLISLIAAIGGVLSSIFGSKAGISATTDIREELFKKIQSLSFKSLDDITTGHLITRLTSDVTQVQNVFLMMLRILVRVPLIIFGSLFMAFLTSRKLFIIVLFISFFIIITIYFISKKAMTLFSLVQKKLDNLNKVIQENLSGMRVIKAFVRMNFENKRFEKANFDITEKSIEAGKIMAAAMPLMMFFMNLGIVCVVYFGGILSISGELPVGKILTFINYLIMMLGSMMFLAFLLIAVSRGEASARRIREVLDKKPEFDNNKEYKYNKIRSGKISFENVNFTYNKEHAISVLKDISFEANPGETIAIIGSTGSGKTTLINLIPNFYELESGKILIDNKHIEEIQPKELRKDIKTVMQESILFSGTIKDNIKFGNENASEEDIVEAAKISQSYEFIKKLPNGFNTVLGQKGVNLSGGQKQRLSIARAIISKPKILIFDDSTSAVDVETEIEIQNSLDNIMKDTTNFIVAQRISTVLEADKIIVLDDGKIDSIGVHEDLMERSKIYKDIYDSQLGNGNNVVKL